MVRCQHGISKRAGARAPPPWLEAQTDPLPLRCSGSLRVALLALLGYSSTAPAPAGLNLDKSPSLQVCLPDAAFAGQLLSTPQCGQRA